jgi:hypothetical protein
MKTKPWNKRTNDSLYDHCVIGLLRRTHCPEVIEKMDVGGNMLKKYGSDVKDYEIDDGRCGNRNTIRRNDNTMRVSDFGMDGMLRLFDFIARQGPHQGQRPAPLSGSA